VGRRDAPSLSSRLIVSAFLLTGVLCHDTWHGY
jgi:hypothetical protein